MKPHSDQGDSVLTPVSNFPRALSIKCVSDPPRKFIFEEEGRDSAAAHSNGLGVSGVGPGPSAYGSSALTERQYPVDRGRCHARRPARPVGHCALGVPVEPRSSRDHRRRPWPRSRPVGLVRIVPVTVCGYDARGHLPHSRARQIRSPRATHWRSAQHNVGQFRYRGAPLDATTREGGTGSFSWRFAENSRL